jgi:hypothetical protein
MIPTICVGWIPVTMMFWQFDKFIHHIETKRENNLVDTFVVKSAKEGGLSMGFFQRTTTI